MIVPSENHGAEATSSRSLTLEERLVALAYPQQDMALQVPPPMLFAPSWQIYLLLPEGSHAVWVFPQTTGAKLINYMIDILGYEGSTLRLTFMSRRIMAGRFLADYGIVSESNIVVHGRIRGA
jgi:hypothetical protein